MAEQPLQPDARVEDLDLSMRRVHGANLEGAKFTETYLEGADISGDIAGLLINGVEVEPLIRAELDRREPRRLALRSTEIEGLRQAWSMLEGVWQAATERVARLPEDIQLIRVDGEWSFVETLRHLVFATDCWVLRAVRLESRPYHPWGLPWSGVGQQSAEAVGLDTSAAPGLELILPVRLERQGLVRSTLETLTDADLLEVRTAPDEPGHPSGEHSVLQCLHVLMNEEWEHHRYAVRDLDQLEAGTVST